MTSSAQLEREAEQTRSQLAQTLDELRQRITPGQLVDEAVDYARDSGGGQFFRNLGHQATSNPMPVALIGAGMAWLMLSNDRTNRAEETAIQGAQQTATETAAQVGDLGQQTSEEIEGFGQEASQRAKGWLSDASDRVTDARERFRGRAEGSRGMAEQSSQSIRSRASDAASSISDRAGSAYEAARSG
ncbi:MAG: DUF3618 domain-containing protein, partial [Xanthobacteraceae bacterium]